MTPGNSEEKGKKCISELASTMRNNLQVSCFSLPEFQYGQSIFREVLANIFLSSLGESGEASNCAQLNPRATVFFGRYTGWWVLKC